MATCKKTNIPKEQEYTIVLTESELHLLVAALGPCTSSNLEVKKKICDLYLAVYEATDCNRKFTDSKFGDVRYIEYT